MSLFWAVSGMRDGDVKSKDTEEGARLRQSTPFTGILTSREWKEIDDSYAI